MPCISVYRKILIKHAIPEILDEAVHFLVEEMDGEILIKSRGKHYQISIQGTELYVMIKADKSLVVEAKRRTTIAQQLIMLLENSYKAHLAKKEFQQEFNWDVIVGLNEQSEITVEAMEPTLLGGGFN